MLRLILASLLLVFTYSSAMAQDQSQQLKSLFETLLDQQKNAFELEGKQLAMDGSVVVEAIDSYYAITLPYLVYADAEGRQTDIGMVAINAMPGKNNDVWNMTIAFPTPIRVLDAKGNIESLITIGAQQSAGVWNNAYDIFTRLQGRFDNIRIESQVDQSSLNIGSLNINYNFSEGENGLWSGPANFTLNNIELAGPKSGQKASIGQFSFISEIVDLDMSADKALRDTLHAFTENVDHQSTLSPDHIAGLYNTLSSYFLKAFDAMKSKIVIQDVKIEQPGLFSAASGQLSLSRAAFGVDILNIKNNKTALDISGGYDDLTFTPMTKDQEIAVPTNLNAKVLLQDVPLKTIMDSTNESIVTSIKSPQNARFSALQTLLSLPQILSDNGTVLSVDGTYAGNALYYVTANGKVTASTQSPYGGVGTVTIDIRGLDDVIESWQTRLAGVTDDERASEIRKTLSVLSMLKLAGQSKDNADNQSIHTYDITLTDKGKVLINNTDMSLLLKGPGQ